MHLLHYYVVEYEVLKFLLLYPQMKRLDSISIVRFVSQCYLFHGSQKCRTVGHAGLANYVTTQHLKFLVLYWKLLGLTFYTLSERQYPSQLLYILYYMMECKM